MSNTDLAKALADHRFTANMSDGHRARLFTCCRLMTFQSEALLAQEGKSADVFYLIRSGRVAIEMHGGERGALAVQTLGNGDVVGWSWIVPPHYWQFDARAIGPVETIALDAVCLRALCGCDHELGYQLLRRLVAVISSRLAATRLQVMDLYK